MQLIRKRRQFCPSLRLFILPLDRCLQKPQPNCYNEFAYLLLSSSSTVTFCYVSIEFLVLSMAKIELNAIGVENSGIVKLRCSVKNYDWGKLGNESTVARLYASNSGEEQIEDDHAYAEFWMGTHESGPSYAILVEGNGVVTNGDSGEEGGRKRNSSSLVSLKDWIGKNPSVLGDKVLRNWGPNLPFLFKVIF